MNGPWPPYNAVFHHVDFREKLTFQTGPLAPLVGRVRLGAKGLQGKKSTRLYPARTSCSERGGRGGGREEEALCEKLAEPVLRLGQLLQFSRF